MAKSTNHTAHNQSYKKHRNGIHKPVRFGPLGARAGGEQVNCSRALVRVCTEKAPLPLAEGLQHEDVEKHEVCEEGRPDGAWRASLRCRLLFAHAQRIAQHPSNKHKAFAKKAVAAKST